MDSSVRTGIEHRPPVNGAVPEYTEREAARFAGYNWTEYLALRRAERVQVVAHFHLHRLLELHEQDAIAADTRRRQRRRRRRMDA